MQKKKKKCVEEMRMLGWMCNQTRKSKKNKLKKISTFRSIQGQNKKKHIQEYLGVASMDDKLREPHLRWSGHIQHKPATAPVRKSFPMQVNGPTRKRDMPKRAQMGSSKYRTKEVQSPSKDLT